MKYSKHFVVVTTYYTRIMCLTHCSENNTFYGSIFIVAPSVKSDRFRFYFRSHYLYLPTIRLGANRWYYYYTVGPLCMINMCCVKSEFNVYKNITNTESCMKYIDIRFRVISKYGTMDKKFICVRFLYIISTVMIKSSNNLIKLFD